MTSAHRVYPHVCGATAYCVVFLFKKDGLSPRVWGNQVHVPVEIVDDRSIPTCVGQPWWLAVGMAVHKVYPHVCGATAPALLRRP